MGKSESEIRMDYNNALRQAETLDGIARELKHTADKELQDCISEISHSWTGENAAAYVGKCGKLKSSIAKSAGKLEKTADTIRRIAGNTYNAEMSALRIAQERKY